MESGAGCSAIARRAGSFGIVNVSSDTGAIAEMGAGAPGYSTSKAALNALSHQLAANLNSQGTLVNAVCSGWVATDMGRGGHRMGDDARARRTDFRLFPRWKTHRLVISKKKSTMAEKAKNEAS